MTTETTWTPQENEWLASKPAITATTGVRCWRCEKLLAVQVTPPYVIICFRCKAKNAQTC